MPYTKEQQQAYDAARREQKHSYYILHKEEFRKRKKAWLKTPNGIEARKREKASYYRKHHAECLVKMRAYSKAHKEERRIRRAKNREHVNAVRKLWASRNKSKLREISRRTYINHKPERNKRSKDYYESHKARMLVLARQWADEHREKRRQICREWSKRNPEKVLACVNRRRARLLAATTDSSADDFYAKVRSKSEVQCAYCGNWVSGRSIHVDHIVPIAKGGSHSADNLCTACADCNYRKNSNIWEVKYIGGL